MKCQKYFCNSYVRLSVSVCVCVSVRWACLGHYEVIIKKVRICPASIDGKLEIVFGYI